MDMNTIAISEKRDHGFEREQGRMGTGGFKGRKRNREML